MGLENCRGQHHNGFLTKNQSTQFLTQSISGWVLELSVLAGRFLRRKENETFVCLVFAVHYFGAAVYGMCARGNHGSPGCRG
jgi:hypothetical protein